MKGLVRYNPATRGLLDWGFGSLIDGFERFFDEPILTVDTRTPRVDVREEDGKYILEADIPGLTEKDIDVKVEGNLLSLSSAKKEEKEEKKNGYLIKERRAYSFSRTFTLPDDVSADKIEAKFKNGLLTLDMPKNPNAQPRNIQVKGE